MTQYLSKLQRDESLSDERRNKTRELVSGWSAAVFLENGMNASVEIKDISVGGAGLLFTGQPGLIVTEAIVTVCIRALHRHFTRRGNVRWVQTEGTEVRFGVEYIDHVGLAPQTHLLDVDTVRIDPACALRMGAIKSVL